MFYKNYKIDLGDTMRIQISENNEEYDVLFTVKDEERNKEYILYTDINSDIDISEGISPNFIPQESTATINIVDITNNIKKH